MAAHHHGHQHGRTGRDKLRLRITLVLVLAYMVAEVIGGLASDSLALMADAGHMFADVGSLALSLAALWIAERPPTPQRTFGYYRAEILAALANGALLVAVSIFILVEAVERFEQPHAIRGGLMLVVASGGLAVNLVALFILHGGSEQSLNMRGAWLHVLADALGSAGAMLAGVLIWAFSWYWVDAAISIVIGVLIVASAWGLVQESVSILMEGAPAGIDVDEVRDAIKALPGVISVHDLHIWTITSGVHALAAHVVADRAPPYRELLDSLRRTLHDRFGFDHLTVQIEPQDWDAECRDS
ncbi:MAG TPA: cation diffusion facilitator family transporter [Pirellulales bacterium]|jgi:cobalt-zinc-cadmium efflux system protein|nr:cation diffusion facilitator family transporter [Pirellulales bacterium]